MFGLWPKRKRKVSTKWLLLNERGEVAECTAANIFAVKNRKIYTPAAQLRLP